MKKTILLFTTIAAFSLISCGSSTNYKEERTKTTEELKAELKQLEFNSPLDYLENKNVILQPQEKKVKKGNLFHAAEYALDGAIIEGNFINKATLATFKDIVIKVSFYSQTKTLINEKSYVIYEYYTPNSIKHFSVKIDMLPQAFKSFSFEITGATPVYK